MRPETKQEKPKRVRSRLATLYAELGITTVPDARAKETLGTALLALRADYRKLQQFADTLGCCCGDPTKHLTGRN